MLTGLTSLLVAVWLLLQRGVPEGTPVVPVRDLPSRPRRNRKSETVRRAFSETYLHPGGWSGP